MRVSVITPQPALADFISIIWLFESEEGIPATDSRVIVPNGQAKLLIPYQNSLSVTGSNMAFQTSEQDVLLTGLQQRPITISSTSRQTGTIGFEVMPKGLYRLFDIDMSQTANRACKVEAVLGAFGRAVHQALARIHEPKEKVDVLQRLLINHMLTVEKTFPLLDSVLDLIVASDGMVTIQELETKTGYSKRYLDYLFGHHVGLSPKSLANILRFQKFYKRWATDQSVDFSKGDLYAHYYDQSHFIKDFKRYTGFTPQTYNRLTTDFARAFYAR